LARTKPLFADFGVRILGLFFDFIIVVFAATALNDHVLARVGLNTDYNGAVILGFAFLYFIGFWISPLRASPGQLLAGIRVVSTALETLSPLRATFRSAALAGLVAGAFLILEVPPRALQLGGALLAYALAFLAAVTPNRQGAHDWLAQSIVVNRKTLNSTERREQLAAHLSDVDPATLHKRRPTVLRMTGDAIGLAVPVFVLFNVALMQHDRDIVYRTNYAYWETANLKTAVAAYHDVYGEWPGPGSDLGVSPRGNYPDGGYYELEDDGVIRIRFEVLPDLVKGNIVVTPVLGEDGFEWKCHAEGEIARNHLPADCRDNPSSR
jgi:uncharacterized RDD family membrane protein YckC